MARTRKRVLGMGSFVRPRCRLGGFMQRHGVAVMYSQWAGVVLEAYS